MASFSDISFLLFALFTVTLINFCESAETNQTLKIELSQTCLNTSQCHDPKALCIAEHCTCPLGSFASPHKPNVTESCISTTCKNTTDCTAYGVSTCTASNTCSCVKPNHLDPITQKCINFEEIKNNCTSNHQCGEHFRCNSGVCQCTFGYTQIDTECKEFKCTDDASCQTIYGAHMKCNSTSTKATPTCQCAPPFELEPKHESCKLPLDTKVAINCSPGDCGDNAMCIEGKCGCPFGMKPEVGGYHCKEATCSDDSFCRGIFSTNDTMCRKDTKRCECFPPTKYRLDVKTQTCINIADPPSCSPTTKCLDDNAQCISGHCICKIGFIPKPTGTCEPFPCNFYTDECGGVFPFAVCSNKKATNSTCVCKAQFKLDADEVNCVKEENLVLVFGVIGVVGVLFLGPLLFFGIKKVIC